MAPRANVALRRQAEPEVSRGKDPVTNRQFIEIASVRKAFPVRGGGAVSVLSGIDLSIAENEFVSLVGRSGCGKTTLLNIIAGLEAATGGERRVAGASGDRPGHGQGVVFQQHALFPWLPRRAMSASGSARRGCRKANAAPAAWSFCGSSASQAASASIRANCPAACSSGCRSRARWRSIRRSC